MTETSSQADWKRRMLAPRFAFPAWSIAQPDLQVYMSNQDGKWELYAWDRAADSHRQITSRPHGTTIGAIDWLGEWVWWFDDDSGSEWGVWRKQKFVGGRHQLALPGLSAGFEAGLALARDSVAVALALNSEFVALAGSSSGSLRTIWTSDSPIRVCGISGDSRFVCTEHSEHGDSRNPGVAVLEITGGAVGEYHGEQGSGVWGGEWSPVKGDHRLILYRERSDRLTPMVWSPLSGSVVELPREFGGEVSASWYPDGRNLLLLHDHAGESYLFRWKLDTDSIDPIATPAGTIPAARVRPDGTVWYYWSDSSSPGCVRSTSGPVLPTEPTTLAPTGTPYALLSAREVPFYLVLPVGRQRPYRTLFHLHGGPHANDSNAFYPRVQAWVDQGFAVVLPNYRGSTGYGKEWRDAIVGNPGFAELEDIAVVHDQLISDGISDSRCSCIWGASWGGYLTLLALGTQPERWALGIAEAPIADYLATYATETEELRSFDQALFGGTPELQRERYQTRSPIEYADRLQAPVMIVAWLNDLRCPMHQINAYVSRLRQADIPHEFIVRKFGHGAEPDAKQIDLLEREFRFIDAVLGSVD